VQRIDTDHVEENLVVEERDRDEHKGNESLSEFDDEVGGQDDEGSFPVSKVPPDFIPSPRVHTHSDLPMKWRVSAHDNLLKRELWRQGATNPTLSWNLLGSLSHCIHTPACMLQSKRKTAGELGKHFRLKTTPRIFCP
jgi:hypothetical protein